MEKNIYVSHFAVGHKLIKHYKSAIVQLKNLIEQKHSPHHHLF